MLEKLELEDLPIWKRLNQQPLTHTQMTALRGGFEFKILNLSLDRLDELDEFAFCDLASDYYWLWTLTTPHNQRLSLDLDTHP